MRTIIKIEKGIMQITRGWYLLTETISTHIFYNNSNEYNINQKRRNDDLAIE